MVFSICFLSQRDLLSISKVVLFIRMLSTESWNEFKMRKVNCAVIGAHENTSTQSNTALDYIFGAWIYQNSTQSCYEYPLAAEKKQTNTCCTCMCVFDITEQCVFVNSKFTVEITRIQLWVWLCWCDHKQQTKRQNNANPWYGPCMLCMPINKKEWRVKLYNSVFTTVYAYTLCIQHSEFSVSIVCWSVCPLLSN